ncbi:MAG: hypothetical protein GX366_02240 [Epulopiscium sp.]|nr:hypothetical protein [Candidatus Epulonipiscium sp.]
MKDVTFGVKVPEDLRDEINELMKASGLVGREFMQELVDSYMLDRHKKEIPEMSEEIKELQSLTHRINEMYLYLGTRFQDIINQNKREQEEINKELSCKDNEYENKLREYKDKIEQLKDDKVDIQKQLDNVTISKEESDQKIRELTEQRESYKELSNQYKNNIENLSKEVASLKELKVKNKALAKTNKVLEEKNDNIASDLWFAKRDIEKLSNKLISNKEEYESSILSFKKQSNLEKQAAILELQLENQKKVEDLNNRLANMQAEYNEKLKEILFDIENTKTGADNNESGKNATN